MYSACHISVNLYYLGGVFVNFYFSTAMSVQEIWSERGYSRQALNRLKIWFLPFLVLYFIEKSQNITEDSPLSCSPFLYLWLSGQRHQAPTQRWSRYCQFSRSLCPTLCDPMDYSMPGFPVHHQLPEFTQTHVHQVGDAIQPSPPLLSPSPPALNLSQHQELFKWVSSSHQVAKVLELQLQHQSFQWLFRTDSL